MPLDPRLHRRIILDIGGTLEHRARIQMHVDARLEENGARQEFTLRNHQRSAAVRGQPVNRALDGRGVQRHPVAHRPRGGNGQSLVCRSVTRRAAGTQQHSSSSQSTQPEFFDYSSIHAREIMSAIPAESQRSFKAAIFMKRTSSRRPAKDSLQ